MSDIPDWVKLFGGITLGAYFFITVAIPALIVVVPPLLIGGYIYTKGSQFWRKRQANTQWDLVNHSSLVFNPQTRRSLSLLPSPEQINTEIANFQLNRIIDAFWANENGISDYFRVENVDRLALGTLEGVQYNYDSNSSLFSKDYTLLVTQQRSLYDTQSSKKIANCILSLKCLEPPLFEGGVDPTANIGKSSSVIQISAMALGGRKFLIDTPSIYSDGDNNDDDDVIINVKGRTRNVGQ
ncbi:hypothetical protein FOA43_004240 [Brettanomyces nanus]|uniref:Uncharacterized protein n=1 Tax=Eeniella nana TaxID=13502 RepID=A0A875S685_EENNA|nr:uncharacterized protein FOA43_004240 [Brettanomyces nanus]QPG76846.1 hypothetical protein FOA43_004240 [Brettanomyces nanus]